MAFHIQSSQWAEFYTLSSPAHDGHFWRTPHTPRNDAGHNTFNSSEIAGNLAGAIVSDAYYPRPERTWGKTGQKWVLQLGIDAFFDVAKEFWPDIDRHIFHGRYGSTEP